jgi:hypothetical protein
MFFYHRQICAPLKKCDKTRKLIATKREENFKEISITLGLGHGALFVKTSQRITNHLQPQLAFEPQTLRGENQIF